ncbi:hypothetical protein GOBAR_AA11930 [Gossypium barbadense]|uniref:Endonuclease/exonuclease/phosphatase domain-containing protein n=1 Tax=Gossypium barbadense TaxID=3634 RepID=A0A2P5XZI9_GOSBA|nr:hypothetical protein GOBAR_AA11930 [Gossypium barbadense]
MEDDSPIRFTAFYGYADPNKRQSSWNMIRRVGQSINEKWIIVGDFSAILDEAKKEGNRRKSTVLMEDFRTIVDELAMVDLKTDNAWFTWVNNREGIARVKERLDRFFMSSNTVNSFPFLETRVIRQSSSDHDAISLDTEGRRPRDGLKDPRLCFKYDRLEMKMLKRLSRKLGSAVLRTLWRRFRLWAMSLEGSSIRS